MGNAAAGAGQTALPVEEELSSGTSSSFAQVQRTLHLSKIDFPRLKEVLNGTSPLRKGCTRTDWILQAASSVPASSCEVYYDNTQLALTLRGWWLVESNGEWLLRVPAYKASGTTVQLTGYDEVTVQEDILERLGLVQHAEAMRKGAVKSMEYLLSQANVRPIAIISMKQHTFNFQKCGSESGAEKKAKRLLQVKLTHASFDVMYAEDGALVQMLFERGVQARDLLEESCAEFILKGEKVKEELKKEEDEGKTFNPPARVCEVEDAELEKELVEGLAEISLSGFKISKTSPKALVTYLQRLRPTHFRALRRAGVID